MTITSYEFLPQDLEDLIDGLSSDDLDSSTMTLIYRNTDHPEDGSFDDYNFNIYLDSEGTYIHSGYNWTKDREYISYQELIIPSPPIQGPEDYRPQFTTDGEQIPF